MTTPNGLRVGDRATLHPFPFEGMECPECGRTPMEDSGWTDGMGVRILVLNSGKPSCRSSLFPGCGSQMRYDTVSVRILTGLYTGGHGGVPWTWLQPLDTTPPLP